MLSHLLLSVLLSVIAVQTEKIFTAEDLFMRNGGTPEQRYKQFPPHKVIGNIYYVGTENLPSFLITTAEGHILINTLDEVSVPVIQDSVAKLGFHFKDIKIVLGSHAHPDHMEGDARVKQLTGARVMAMQEDIPALEKMRPGGKPHPIDGVLHDGDKVTLGGVTLVAHLTPGHTPGCTTWTLKAQEGGRTYDVVIVGSVSVGPGMKLVGNKDVPDIVDQYRRAFKILRSLPCDVPLASHAPAYSMADKYARVGNKENPFIDPNGYTRELDISERAFNMLVEQQKKLP